MEFPRTAVIYPQTKENAIVLLEFLAEAGFKMDGETPICDIDLDDIWDFDEGNTCFDISTSDMSIFHAGHDYYQYEFEDDYPNSMPDEGRYFLCSVDDFICWCSETERPEFEPEDDVALHAFLFA